MSTSGLETTLAGGDSARDDDRQAGLWPRVRLRLRSRIFWQVQAMVGFVTASHYVMEGATSAATFDHVHHMVPALYVFPIIYASLRSGREGGLWTGLWCSLLTFPNVALWHQASYEWLVEFVQIGSSVIVGLVLSARVEQEAAARRRAEEMADRMVLVNRRITRAQEDERLRIARELHDDTVQSLVLLCHRLDALAETAGMPRAAQEPIRDLRAVAEDTLVGVRQFSRDLRPSILDDLGLVAAVEWLTEEFSDRSGVTAALTVSGAPRRFQSEAELALFRITQEALRNIEKHAGASDVSVAIVFDAAGLRLSVGDDGVGLPGSQSIGDLVASGKLGITGMLERARLAGATLELDSQPGHGTAVTVTLDAAELPV